MEQQALHLDRVRAAIGDAISRFVASRLASADPTFTAEQLRAAVSVVSPTAPASADRVLRDLRQKGVLMYELVSRRDSKYRALPIARAA